MIILSLRSPAAEHNGISCDPLVGEVQRVVGQ